MLEDFGSKGKARRETCSFLPSSHLIRTDPSYTQLAKLAFLSVKDAREIISSLSSANLIEPQEVPRSADRAPSRTFFLWFVDYAKAVTTLTSHLYKALANLQAQKQYQLQLRSTLVQKRERSDVRADMSLLSAVDLAGLEELDRIMEALTVAEMRIDADLFVLRELET